MKTPEAPPRGREARGQAKASDEQGVARRPATQARRGRTKADAETAGPASAPKRASGSFPAPRAAGSQPPETSLSFRKSEGAPLPIAGEVTGDELAGLLGVAPRSVRSLAERGVVVRSGRGRYDLAASVPRYCESLRQAAAGRGGDVAVAALSAERSRLAREQADAAAMKNAAMRRELVPAADVEREWSAILKGLRAALLAVPSRAQQRLAHLTAHDVAALDDEIRSVLAEVARAEP